MTKKKSKRKHQRARSLESYSKLLRKQGFQQDPLLQDPKDADVTFIKKLPDGSRLHLRVKEGRDWINVEEHRDKSDPSRYPVSHVLDVLLDDPKHTKYRVPLRKPEKKKRT